LAKSGTESVTGRATPLRFRAIQPSDDAAVAAIIRQVLPEFGGVGPGFAINDAEVDAMCVAYSRPGCAYFVVVTGEDGEKVVGGGGVAPLEGGSSEVCELRKMYFLPEARGTGMGEALLRQCLLEAKRLGYRTCYLETLGRMAAARKLYERMGFKVLNKPMGKTGHFSCDSWYARDL
jgi:putative acetyltransferase